MVRFSSRFKKWTPQICWTSQLVETLNNKAVPNLSLGGERNMKKMVTQCCLFRDNWFLLGRNRLNGPSPRDVKKTNGFFLLAFFEKKTTSLGEPAKKKRNHHRTTKVKRMLNSGFREMQRSASLASYQLELRQETTVQTHSGPCMHIRFQVDPEGSFFQ